MTKKRTSGSLMNPKRRRLNTADKAAIRRAGLEVMLEDIEEMEQRAHHLGAHVTAHALNRAKNALGWELAGNVEQAGKAALRK